MKYLLILSVLLFQLSFGYEYRDSVKQNLIAGCLNAGASQEFCICQAKAIQQVVPQSELNSLQKSIVLIYRGGSPENLPEEHIRAMQKIEQCIGL